MGGVSNSCATNQGETLTYFTFSFLREVIEIGSNNAPHMKVLQTSAHLSFLMTSRCPQTHIFQLFCHIVYKLRKFRHFASHDRSMQTLEGAHCKGTLIGARYLYQNVLNPFKYRNNK